MPSKGTDKTKSCSIAILYNLVKDWTRPDINSVITGVNGVKAALERLGHRPFLLPVHDGLPNLVETLDLQKPDLVFNLCEGFEERSEGEYCIAAVLDLIQIPYTGSPPITLALGLDKSRSKEIFLASGIPTPPYAVYRQFSTKPPPLEFPMILKLAREDASLGITKDNVVTDDRGFVERMRALFKEHRSPVLIEEFIDGREFIVAILDDEPIVLEEIEFKVEPKLLCYKAKWATGSPEDLGTISVFSPRVTRKERRQIFDLSMKVWQTLEIRDYGRVDFRMNHKGELFVLEANPNPDITPGSGYNKSLDAAGIQYDEFIAHLVDTALRRAA
ncbi:MAG: D-alanine--D-alanine ligase family protein [bacterium]